MRVAVTGVTGALGRGVAARLVSRGHDVVGIGPRRPDSWPGTVDFVDTDLRDFAAVCRAMTGADAVAHCASGVSGAATVLEAMTVTGTRRIVFASSVYAYGPRPAGTPPITEDDELRPAAGPRFALQAAQVERMLAESGVDWVAIRSGIVMGRETDNRVFRLFAAPVFADVDGFGDRRLPVVHTDDAQRVFVRAILDADIGSGAVNLEAAGDTTVRDLIATVGRPLVRIPKMLTDVGPTAAHSLLHDVPVVDTTRLRDEWGYVPVWSAKECLEDFALAARGRVALGPRVFSLPWRLTRVQEIPAVDAPDADGVIPVAAGIDGANGEFDTPIDPRFPAYVATNLSEALPGPFSPSSASVTVRGVRAGGVKIAERLRPGGVVQREMALRTTGVFGHRLYAAVTATHFMGETVPFVDTNIIISQIFGCTVDNLPIFGAQRPPEQQSGLVAQLRNIATFGGNLLSLCSGSHRDTRDFVADIDGLESLAARPSRFDDQRLRSVILLARDQVVHGWMLSSAALLLCAAHGVILRVLCGRDITPDAGPGLVSAHTLGAVHGLVEAARRDPAATSLLAESGPHLDALRERAPEFYASLTETLDFIGHRGPGEVEMRSLTYADDPELLLRMVTKAVDAPATETASQPSIALWARPSAKLAAFQLRDREVRRDKMVRAIWVLRTLLREYGGRMVDQGVLNAADDIFFLLVDELDAQPPDIAALVARRRAEQASLAEHVPPPAFSGGWVPSTKPVAVLTAGQTLRGLGVCGGRVRGRVRIVEPDTLDDLQVGEVLVAKVTDVGYTPAFAYAAAVVTELGGPISHAAIVAREFGFPCVVNAPDATHRLLTGTLVEVDGESGEIHVLDPESDPDSSQPSSDAQTGWLPQFR